MTPAPPDGPIVERRWSWDDGTADATTTAASTTKTFADNGTYDVRLQVRDAWGQTAEMTKPVVVANVAPTVDAGPDEPPQATLDRVVAAAADPGTARLSGPD